MILRRIAEAFRRQDWFTVFVETMIVVLGVFVGLQVNNWNAARQQSLLADAYLVRLSGDLTAMESYLEEMIEEASARYDLTLGLLQAAADGSANDDALIAATQAFFTKGWKTPRFTITDSVYTDLTSTGNLSLIEADLRQKIASYYADLDLRKEKIAIGRDWSLPNDSRFIVEHDVYRWDQAFADLANASDPAIRRETIISARRDLARLASMFIYIEKSALEDYRAALVSTRTLAAAVAGNMGGQK